MVLEGQTFAHIKGNAVRGRRRRILKPKDHKPNTTKKASNHTSATQRVLSPDYNCSCHKKLYYFHLIPCHPGQGVGYRRKRTE